uniref:Uncharacterized protein LOC114330961 n=1 Tax=Diabrotica virgifera virgifera TaxID=50390 RepID=A0A6P7FJI1_DIAVI
MSGGGRSCAVCSDNFIVNTKLVKCDFCCECYHTNCAKVKDQFLKLKQDADNFMWFCNNCLPKVRVFTSGRGDLSNSKHEELIERTSKLINLLESSDSLPSNKPSYASWSDVVKKNKTEPLIIKPKNLNQNSSVTKSVLSQKVDPNNINVALTEVKQGFQSKLMIHCQDKQSLSIQFLTFEYRKQIDLMKTKRQCDRGIYDQRTVPIDVNEDWVEPKDI